MCAHDMGEWAAIMRRRPFSGGRGGEPRARHRVPGPDRRRRAGGSCSGTDGRDAATPRCWPTCSRMGMLDRKGEQSRKSCPAPLCNRALSFLRFPVLPSRHHGQPRQTAARRLARRPGGSAVRVPGAGRPPALQRLGRRLHHPVRRPGHLRPGRPADQGGALGGCTRSPCRRRWRKARRCRPRTSDARSRVTEGCWRGDGLGRGRTGSQRWSRGSTCSSS